MTRRGVLAVVLAGCSAAGCYQYTIDSGRRDRRPGEAASTETRTVGKAGIPVEVFLDRRSLGVFDTDADGQVRVDLRQYLGAGPRPQPHTVEFLIHDPDVTPGRLGLVAPPGR